MDVTVCKSCRENINQKAHISIEKINEAIDNLAKVKRIKFVDDDTYSYRLSKCRECRYLESETTCLQCGCIVQIKAKLSDSRCPFPKNDYWRRSQS